VIYGGSFRAKIALFAAYPLTKARDSLNQLSLTCLDVKPLPAGAG
jgi:hypothetical protein